MLKHFLIPQKLLHKQLMQEIKIPKKLFKKEPKLIAQGTYGCVYDPSLYCNDPDTFEDMDPKTRIPKYYKGKVSKIMMNHKAAKEIDE